MKIVISGASLYNNLGGPSIFHGLVRILRRSFPKCTMVYHYHEKETLRPGKTNIERAYPDVFFINSWPKAKSLILGASLKKWLGGYGVTEPSAIRILEELRTSNLYIDAVGIAFADNLSRTGVKGLCAGKPLIRAAAMFGVKAVHYTASYGPMFNRWSRITARRVLGKHCSLVYCREIKSKDLLLDCGVNKHKLLVAPDTGLLMPYEPISIEGRDNSSPLIGISVSSQIMRHWKASQPYLDIIAQVCDNAIRQWKAQVLLIPNEISPNGKGYADCSVAKDIMKRLESKTSALIFPAERYDGPQLKSAISQCDLLIASRYHSIVAAMSTGVPTVVVGWHHKYEELLSKFNQGDVGLSCDNCHMDALWNLCKNVWARRERIRNTIQECLPAVEREIYQAGEHLKDLIKQ